MFRVPCLGIWWRYDIWILEKLKLDYVKEVNSFQSQIKNIFPCFASDLLSFRYTKQTCKIVVDATFKCTTKQFSVFENIILNLMKLS